MPNFSFSCLSLSQSCLRKSGQGVGRLSEWFQCSAEQHKWKRMRLAVELIPWGKTITSRKTWLDHTNTHSWRTQKHTHTNMPHLSLFYRLLWTVSYQGTHTPHSGVEFYCHLRFLASNGYENKKKSLLCRILFGNDVLILCCIPSTLLSLTARCGMFSSAPCGRASLCLQKNKKNTAQVPSWKLLW